MALLKKVTYNLRRLMYLRHPAASDCSIGAPILTGWRRPIGCLKLQVSCCKRATNYRALAQKITYKDKVSFASSPPSYKD